MPELALKRSHEMNDSAVVHTVNNGTLRNALGGLLQSVEL